MFLPEQTLSPAFVASVLTTQDWPAESPVNMVRPFTLSACANGVRHVGCGKSAPCEHLLVNSLDLFNGVSLPYSSSLQKPSLPKAASPLLTFLKDVKSQTKNCRGAPDTLELSG